MKRQIVKARVRVALWLIAQARRLLKMPDSAADPFESGCVYCGIDCNDPENEHSADCPSSTGIYPVTLQEMWPGGPACCEGCGTTLWPGDTYFHIEIEGGPVPIFQVACTGCALLAELAGES